MVNVQKSGGWFLAWWKLTQSSEKKLKILMFTAPFMVKLDFKVWKIGLFCNFTMGALTGDSPIFTPRSSHLDVTAPNLNPPPPSLISLHPPTWIPMPSLTTFYSPPPRGLMPGQQWLTCGACHSSLCPNFPSDVICALWPHDFVAIISFTDK